jgi:hypothetical protein
MPRVYLQFWWIDRVYGLVLQKFASIEGFSGVFIQKEGMLAKRIA